jgi:hypothetical protein
VPIPWRLIMPIKALECKISLIEAIAAPPTYCSLLKAVFCSLLADHRRLRPDTCLYTRQ